MSQPTAVSGYDREPYRTDWSSWAAHAEPRICQGCKLEFAPNHPRRRFCQRDECPGRRPGPTRRRRSSARAQAAARSAGVAGFLGDVLMESHRQSDPTADAMGRALVDMVRAERAGERHAARAAAVRMCALGAARAVLLVPPVTE